MVKDNKAKQLIDESDGSWSGAEEGKGKKKPSVKVVHAQIVDQAAQKKSTEKAKSEKIVPAQKEEQKEDGRMLKSTKEQTSKGLLKQVVFEKKV